MVWAYIVIYLLLSPLLVTRSISTHVDGPCTQTQIAEDLDYCGDSLLLGTPWVLPPKICCENIQKNKMKCICQSVTKVFFQYFDVNKLPKLSQACGNLLIPGSYCGLYKVPGVHDSKEEKGVHDSKEEKAH